MNFSDINNISDCLKFYSRTQPDKPFLVSEDSELTYIEANNLIEKTCNFFKEKSLNPGQIVSMVIKNSLEYVIIYLSCLRIGLVVNPYPYSLDPRDILRYIQQIDSSIVMSNEKHYEFLESNIDRDIKLVDDDFFEEVKEYNSKTDNFFSPESLDPAAIYYSSGTTGNPKSVVFSHKNIMSNISSIVRGFKHKKEHTHLIVLPLGHTASINYSFLPSTLAGGTLFIAESFWKIRSRFWKIVKEYKINYVELVPSIVIALLNTPYKKEDYVELQSLKYIGCGSATLPLEIQQSFSVKYNLPVANLYGLSETGPTHVDLPVEENWKPGTIGKPLDVNKVYVIDNEGNKLGCDKEGEICIEGDNVFIDYYRNTDLYRKVVIDGVFYTGDLGYYDKDNIFHFTGRKKDLIIKGGINISPDEIDEVIFQIEQVEEVATVGVPDAFLGEKIISFIVPKHESGLTINFVKEHCKSFLSPSKFPDSIIFIESMPKGPSGKILRKVLREKYNV